MACGCSSSEATCPVSRAIGVFQEKWVLHIVHTLLDGPRGFNELGREVGGCNPTTLAQRLARLESLGLVFREADCEGGRSSYALTEAGAALEDVIAAIRAWSASHLTEDGVAHGVSLGFAAAGEDGTLNATPHEAARHDATMYDATPQEVATPPAAPSHPHRVAVGHATRVLPRDERGETPPPVALEPS